MSRLKCKTFFKDFFTLVGLYFHSGVIWSSAWPLPTVDFINWLGWLGLMPFFNNISGYVVVGRCSWVLLPLTNRSLQITCSPLTPSKSSFTTCKCHLPHCPWQQNQQTESTVSSVLVAWDLHGRYFIKLHFPWTSWQIKYAVHCSRRGISVLNWESSFVETLYCSYLIPLPN